VETNNNTAKKTAKPRGPGFLLRMPDPLRKALERCAFAHDRDLTKEINRRLEASIRDDPDGVRVRQVDAQPKSSSGYPATPATVVMHTNDNGPASALSATDQAMLEVFRKMPVDKQLALLSLFK
jgi:hypothetical protein